MLVIAIHDDNLGEMTTAAVHPELNNVIALLVSHLTKMASGKYLINITGKLYIGKSLVFSFVRF